MSTRVLLLAAFFICSLPAMAMQLDGVLNEDEWSEAESIDQFLVVKPYSLDQAGEPTKAQFFSNEDGIYIGVVSFQKNGTQRSERVQRDGDLTGDKVEVIIDFDASGVSAYGFEVGNGGSIRDGIWSSETQISHDWDGNWQAATQSLDDRWVAELFIPWDVAPMSKVSQDSRTVNIYVSRTVGYLGLKYANAPTNDQRQRFVSELPVFQINNHSGAAFSAFVSATARADLLNEEEHFDPSFELFWKIDSSKQLSLALNPDFGQVESDDLVVNFSPDETFFNEKRPLFTENQSLFDLRGPSGLRVLHTRRIGGPTDVGGEPGADIDAALKFSSNGKKLHYGLLAVTENDSDDIQGRDFFAGRVQLASDNLKLGYFNTYADRPDLQRTAMSQTIDYDLGLSENLKLKGQVIHAKVEGLTQEGGDFIDQSDFAYWATVDQQISDSFQHSLEYSEFGDEFEINDLGFLARNNIRKVFYEADYETQPQNANSALKNRRDRLDLVYSETLDGLLLPGRVGVGTYVEFKNTALLDLFANYHNAANDDRITRGNNVMDVGDGFDIGYHYTAKSQKKLRYHHLMRYVDMPIDGRGYQLHIHPTYYFSDHFSTELSIHFHHRDNWLVWQEDNSINSYTRNELDSYLNLNAQLSEKQELRLKFQWVSLSAKADEAHLVGSNGELLSRDEQVSDFSLSDTALQIRYRYKLGPLSNVFLVYSRGGFADYDEYANPWGLFADGWRERQGDNVLLKVRLAI